MQDLKSVSLKSILDFFKESTKTFFIAGVSCAIILFAPESVGLGAIRDGLNPYLKTLFVASFVGLFANISHSIIVYGREKYASFKRVAGFKKISRNFTAEEKKILRQYIENQTRVQSLSAADGVVSDLERHGILFKSTSFIDSFHLTTPYNITDIAWEYLNCNRHLIDHE